MLKKKIKFNNTYDFNFIRNFQKKHKIVIPSDYVNIINTCNGFEIDEVPRFEILNIDGIIITQFEQIIPIEFLEGEFPLIREIEEEDQIEILSNYCPFAFTVSKIILLIGNSKDNINQIFLWNNEIYNNLDSPERLHKIAEDYIDLINNRLVEIPKRN